MNATRSLVGGAIPHWIAIGCLLCAACQRSGIGRGSNFRGQDTTSTGDDLIAPLTMDPDMEQPGWRISPGRAGQTLTLDETARPEPPVLAIADRHSFTFESAEPVSGSYVVEARVRLSDGNHDNPRGSARLEVGLRDGLDREAPAYALALARQRRSVHGYTLTPTIAGNEPQWRQAAAPGERQNLWGRSLTVAPRFSVEDISPLMDERMRVELEADLGHMPEADTLWRTLRIEILPHRVRMVHNGLLVIDDARHVNADGRIRLTVSGEARVAGLRVRELADMRPFVPVPLDDLRNAHGPVDASGLAGKERMITVRGIPIRLVGGDERGDHVDIAASTFRYRRGTGYRPAAHPNHTYPRTTQVDPARLMVHVPARGYRRAWVLAAFDERPSHIPTLTVRFVRPGAGWPIDATAKIPAFDAPRAPNAIPVPTAGPGGDRHRLWLVPIDIDTAALASDYREQGLFHLELTKRIYPSRAFPDPANYGYYQGGLPSGVRVYGLTLEEAPLTAIGRGSRNGNLYPYPEKPVWYVDIENQQAHSQQARVHIGVTDPGGKTQYHERRLDLGAGESRTVRFDIAHDLYGLHTVQTDVMAGDWMQSREGTFLVLPPDTRRATWRNSRFGLWNWQGTHGTNPDPDENHRLMRALGVQTGSNRPWSERRFWGVGPSQHNITGRGVPAWAQAEETDPEALDAFKQRVAEQIERGLEANRDLQYFVSFPEHSLSLRTTHGIPPYAFGQPWFEYTDSETARIRAHEVMGRAAYEVVQEKAPDVDFLFGWVSPSFFLPFFRSGHDMTPYDGYGLDQPQFERMPERQPRATEPSSLYFLHKEMHERDLVKPIVHVESYFHSSHELALGHRKQADMTVRTAALSMALGTTRFLKCWSLHDCSTAWGSQHYGCVGLIGRRPEYNPKPAAAAFATMSEILDLAEYERWLDIGSRSAFCLEFIDHGRGRRVYPVWTIHGERPLTVTLDTTHAVLTVIDENGNATHPAIDDGARATVTLTPTVQWLVVRDGAITTAETGEPVYHDAPGEHVVHLDPLDGNWTFRPGEHSRFQNNHWDVAREPAAMDLRFVESPERGGRVMEITLPEPEEEQAKPLLGRYAVFTPDEPMVIDGKARALGWYARGASAWNRVIFLLEDANGETFQNTGTQDAWNCDDIHSWSSVNFDGWRYMEFPLPASAPGDEYREKDSVWWGSDGDGIVDLPLKLTGIIIEMRTHMVYVNEMVDVDRLTLQLDQLMAVYHEPWKMTGEPVRLQRQARDDLPIDIDPDLPNPIADLRETGEGDAARIINLYQPADRRTGTEIAVSVEPAAGATDYQIWIAAYPDGRGATEVRATALDGEPTELLVRGLQPRIPLYFFVTWTDADGNRSKPSDARKTILADEFPMQ